MEFLHDGRPPTVREDSYTPAPSVPLSYAPQADYSADLLAILSCWNVCSKEWIIRQYDHEVQAGSVVKPLVGPGCDGPSDAAVVRPSLRTQRGLVLSNGMNPRYGDFDPYWMALSAVDEALRNNVAVGGDPSRIAILDNFCWGNTEKPETLGTLVRASIGCHDLAVQWKTPFISGKDSLNNEFTWFNADGGKQTIAIPCSAYGAKCSIKAASRVFASSTIPAAR
jgi:phosphoribosylformylglycinamidine synthase